MSKTMTNKTDIAYKFYNYTVTEQNLNKVVLVGNQTS